MLFIIERRPFRSVAACVSVCIYVCLCVYTYQRALSNCLRSWRLKHIAHIVEYFLSVFLSCFFMEEFKACPSCNAKWPLLRWRYALPELSFDFREHEPRRTVTFCAGSCQHTLYCPSVPDLQCWLEANGVASGKADEEVARTRRSVDQQKI